MIAFSLDNLLFFLLIAVAALFQLLSKAMSKAKRIQTKRSEPPKPQRPRPIRRAPGNPTQIGFVNSSKHWVSRQVQLRLRLFCLVLIFRLDDWPLCNRLQHSQACGDYLGNAQETGRQPKRKYSPWAIGRIAANPSTSCSGFGCGNVRRS